MAASFLQLLSVEIVVSSLIPLFFSHETCCWSRASILPQAALILSLVIAGYSLLLIEGCLLLFSFHKDLFSRKQQSDSKRLLSIWDSSFQSQKSSNSLRWCPWSNIPATFPLLFPWFHLSLFCLLFHTSYYGLHLFSESSKGKWVTFGYGLWKKSRLTVVYLFFVCVFWPGWISRVIVKYIVQKHSLSDYNFVGLHLAFITEIREKCLS